MVDQLQAATFFKPKYPIGDRAHVGAVNDMSQRLFRASQPREAGNVGTVQRNLDDNVGGRRVAEIEQPQGLRPTRERIVAAENGTHTGIGRMQPDVREVATAVRAVKGLSTSE